MNQPLVWTIIGSVFLVFELFLTQFVTLWFGLSALLMALLTLFFPSIPLAAVIAVWGSLSGLMTFFWFYYRRRHQQPVEEAALIGQQGHVIAYNPVTRTGTVRFTVPVQHKNEWHFNSELPVEPGARVEVTGYHNHLLDIQPL